MAHDRYLNDLAKVPLFAECSKKDLAEVARLMTELELSDGQELMHEGGRAGSFVIIESGTADIVKDGQVVNSVGPGDFVGELSLILSHPPNATVRATSDMVVHVADRSGFSQLLEEPGLAKRVLTVVAQRLAEATPDAH